MNPLISKIPSFNVIRIITALLLGELGFVAGFFYWTSGLSYLTLTSISSLLLMLVLLNQKLFKQHRAIYASVWIIGLQIYVGGMTLFGGPLDSLFGVAALTGMAVVVVFFRDRISITIGLLAAVFTYVLKFQLEYVNGVVFSPFDESYKSVVDWVSLAVWAVFLIGGLGMLANRVTNVLSTQEKLTTQLTQSVRDLEALQIELQDKNEQLRSAAERQKELFAVVGHELRTPVAAISMVGRDSDTDAESAREQIVEISENLLAVLEDLRVVVAPERALESKAEEVCDPVQTINRALTPLSQLLKQNAVELHINVSKPAGVNFLLHAQPLRQVVTNLTKNAAIHSGSSVVRVSFDYQSDVDGNCLGSLIVEDDGCGIPEALRKKVLEPFGRGDTEREGSGLGLFIVKQIAELMDGTCDYSTSKLGGACFTLTFPMKLIEVEEKPPASAVSLEGLRILLAEDDAMLRMLTEKLLGKLGVQITSYDNGQKALAAFDASQFDLVLTDLMMPMMDGHELTKSLRSLGAKLPIIGVTAAVIGDETDEWLKDGADAFISKPITPDKLQDALASIGFTLAEAT